MKDATSLWTGDADRPILPWAFVAGAFAHLGVPIYLFAVTLVSVLRAPPHPRMADLLATALPFSGWILAVYAASTVIASTAAWLADPLLRARRRRLQRTDPSARRAAAARHCAVSINRARDLLGGDGAMPLDVIEEAAWDHDDPRFQAIALDLARLVDAAGKAMSSASGDSRANVAATTVIALHGIAAALGVLADEQRRLDQGDVDTLARYVQIRYGSSESSGDASR